MKSRVLVAISFTAVCILTVQMGYAQNTNTGNTNTGASKNTHGSADHSSGHSMKMTTPDSGMEYQVGELVISQAHTRVTPPGASVAAGYLTIKNNGANDDVLLGGKAEFAEKTEVHSMEMVNDVMKMRRMREGLVIPAGKTIELAHGGYHLMFKQLKAPLSMDDKKSVTLNFKEAGELEVPLIVTPLL